MSSIRPPIRRLASGAEIIGTAFYHAFGYHTVDVYLAELDPDRLVIAEKATCCDPFVGERKRLFTRRDIDDVLRRAARQGEGKYRVLVSRFADGKPLGNFRYYGTRPDDPNDIVAHEHRRELRGARVFGAWLNHDDSRGVNSLDMLVGESVAATSSTTCSTSGRSWAAARSTRSASSGQRVHPRVEARLADAGHARPLCTRPGWHLLSGGAALRRAIRGRGVPARAVEAGVSEPSLRQHAPRRCVLGGADRVGFDAAAVRAIVEKASTAIRARPST